MAVNTIRTLVVKEDKLGLITAINNKVKNTRINLGFGQRSYRKISVNSQGVSTMEVYAQARGTAPRNLERFKKVSFEDLKIGFTARSMTLNDRETNRETTNTLLRPFLLASGIEVSDEVLDYASTAPFENVLKDENALGRELLEFVDLDKSLGDLVYVSHTARDEYEDGERTGAVMDYDVTLFSEKEKVEVYVRLRNPMFDFSTFKRGDLVSFEWSNVNAYQGTTELQSNLIRFSFGADDMKKKGSIPQGKPAPTKEAVKPNEEKK